MFTVYLSNFSALIFRPGEWAKKALAMRATRELSGGRDLCSPVIASVEVPSDIRIGKKSVDSFDHTLKILEKRPFCYKDTSFSR